MGRLRRSEFVSTGETASPPQPPLLRAAMSPTWTATKTSSWSPDSVSCFLWSIFHTCSLSDPFKMQIRSCYNNVQNPPGASHHLKQHSKLLPWLTSSPGSGSSYLSDLSSPCSPLLTHWPPCSSLTGQAHTCLGLEFP